MVRQSWLGLMLACWLPLAPARAQERAGVVHGTVVDARKALPSATC